MRAFLIASVACVWVISPVRAQQPPAAPAASIAQRTGGLERHDGYVPFYSTPHAIGS